MKDLPRSASRKTARADKRCGKILEGNKLRLEGRATPRQRMYNVLGAWPQQVEAAIDGRCSGSHAQKHGTTKHLPSSISHPG